MENRRDSSMNAGAHTAGKSTGALKTGGTNGRSAVVRDGWALCPVCWSKLCRVEPGASARGVHLWCKRDREIQLTVEP